MLRKIYWPLAAAVVIGLAAPASAATWLGQLSGTFKDGGTDLEGTLIEGGLVELGGTQFTARFGYDSSLAAPTGAPGEYGPATTLVDWLFFDITVTGVVDDGSGPTPYTNTYAFGSFPATDLLAQVRVANGSPDEFEFTLSRSDDTPQTEFVFFLLNNDDFVSGLDLPTSFASSNPFTGAGYITVQRHGVYIDSEFTIDSLELIGDQAIPEPSTWLLQIVGFGVIGAALRRRRLQPLLAS